MKYVITNMKKEHWDQVASIYKQGIDDVISTFTTEVPTYDEWSASHLDECRFVAISNNNVIGWIALSHISNKYAYRGVCEISIYVDKEYRKMGIGRILLNKEIEESEKNGIWSIFSVIIAENKASIKLHESLNFRKIGYKEKVAKLSNSRWSDTVILERRSKIVGID